MVKMWPRMCFRAHLSDVMHCESHLSRGPVFRRGVVINKSCANCIYSICQLVLHSGVPRSVPTVSLLHLSRSLCWVRVRRSAAQRSAAPSLPSRGEGGWKERSNGTPHAWDAGVCETPVQGAVCCLPGSSWGSHVLVPRKMGRFLGWGSSRAVGWVCSVVWNSEAITDSALLVLLIGTWQVHRQSRRSRQLRAHPEIRTVLLREFFTLHWWIILLKTQYKIHCSPGKT